MVVRIQLTIRHIRGHSFPIEADVDSEIVGLKVQIWESQKIAIENQRLVFSGKELSDNVTLSQMGIGDGATIFLVESMSEIPQQLQSEVPQVTIQVPQVVPVVDGNVTTCQQQQCVGVVPSVVPVNYYEPLEVETALSEERMQSVIDLAFWVRLYCLLGIVISALACIMTLWSLVILTIYLLGYFGTRKVNRCLLAFPLILCFFIGLVDTIMSIYEMADNFYGILIGTFFLGLFHLVIFACICKLMGRIGKLNCQEWCQTRLRIRTKACCF